MKVSWHPQYCDPDDRSVITNYTIYAWEVHPLHGEILGSRMSAQTEAEAKRIAHRMRQSWDCLLLNTEKEVKP